MTDELSKITELALVPPTVVVPNLFYHDSEINYIDLKIPIGFVIPAPNCIWLFELKIGKFIPDQRAKIKGPYPGYLYSQHLQTISSVLILRLPSFFCWMKEIGKSVCNVYILRT
jgi:hypothetical protein